MPKRLWLLIAILSLIVPLQFSISRAAPEPKVLVVDNYETARRMTRHQLLASGFSRIDEAPDIQTALIMLSEQQYALVISDWELSSETGLELLKKMRLAAHTRSIPFLLMIPMDRPELKQAVAAPGLGGPTGTIVKPYTDAKLQTKLGSLLETLKAIAR